MALNSLLVLICAVKKLHTHSPPMTGLLTHPQCILLWTKINWQLVQLAILDKIKDIGIYFDEKIDFKDYIHEKINKAYMIIVLF